MADWIKLEHTTPDKPEVIAMADHLGVDQDAILGKLCRLWIWADQQTITGDAVCVTQKWIDQFCRLENFAISLEKFGWLKSKKGRFSFPNFDRHNGETAKTRALTAKRQRKLRDAKSVTKSATEGEGEGEGEFPLSETRRDETALCDFSVLKSEAERFRGLGLGEKPQDRNLVFKICCLQLSGQVPQDWIEQSIEALRIKSRKNPGAFLTACLKNQAAASGVNLKALLAAVKLPEAAK